MANSLRPHDTGSSGPRLYRSLSVDEIAHVAKHVELLRSSCEWIHNYLAQPHPELGRSGSVCPFAAPALAKDTLRIAVVRFTSPERKREQVVEAVEHYRSAFLSGQDSEKNQLLQSILILFPDVTLEEAAELIDGVKEELKATFVEQGLMLGEFHSLNKSPGLHNPSFLPLRSHVPMLVIRNMVATDFVFLSRPEYDPATRLRFLEKYLAASGMAESSTRAAVERTIASLRAELADAAPRVPGTSRCPITGAGPDIS